MASLIFQRLDAMHVMDDYGFAVSAKEKASSSLTEIPALRRTESSNSPLGQAVGAALSILVSRCSIGRLRGHVFLDRPLPGAQDLTSGQPDSSHQVTQCQNSRRPKLFDLGRAHDFRRRN